MSKSKIYRLLSKKQLAYYAISISLFVLMGSFQNCSNVGLEESNEPSVVRSSPTQLKASICSKVTLQPSAARKFIFIVDLSASNFGNWKAVNTNGINEYFFDTGLATDLNGRRFDAIVDFIDNCSNQTGDQFAIIGFSASAGELKKNTLGKIELNCSSPSFKSPQGAKDQIEALKKLQNQDLAWYADWSQASLKSYNGTKVPDDIIYRETSYTSASQCYEKLIIQELQDTNNTTQNYDVFFISDGVPQDKADSGCENSKLYNTDAKKSQCYLDSNLSSVARSRTAAIAKNKNLTIQGIYYGPSGVKIDVLKAISIEGGTNGAKELDGFENNQGALCELVISQLALESRPDILGLINLNVSRIKGEIQTDSDADGLTDKDETLYSADPTNPRSLAPGILDGLCVNLSSVAKCLEWAEKNSATCNKDLFDASGLSDCDRKYIGFDEDTTQQNPADYDSDGLIDFIEVIKGLDPTKNDLNLDPDQDGLTNLDEIYKGSDPQFPDSYLDVSQLNQTSTTFKYSRQEESLCTYGQWDLTAQKLQTGLTLQSKNSVMKDSIFEYLIHNEFEHSIALVYRLTPMNGSSTETEYYLKGVRIIPSDNPKALSGDVPNAQINLQNINFFSDPLQITPELFKLISKGD